MNLACTNVFPGQKRKEIQSAILVAVREENKRKVMKILVENAT
jgi:hypothetical protein